MMFEHRGKLDFSNGKWERKKEVKIEDKYEIQT